MKEGIPITKFPYSDLSFVGNLLFKEYPSTMIYTDKLNTPFIVEWADFRNETKSNIYYIYKTSCDNLKKYLDKGLSHFDLIMNAEEDVTFLFTGSIENPTNIYLLNVNNILPSYLPSSNSYFTKEESEDISDVIKHFKLSERKVEIVTHLSVVASDNHIEAYSKIHKTELFHIHLNNGDYINHGRAQTNVLGNVLVNLDGLYHEVANDYTKGKDRTKKITNATEKFNYDGIAYTEVVLNRAASFSVYIKPKRNVPIMNFFPEVSDSNFISSGEKIFHDVIEVISKAQSKESMLAIKDKYNHNVFNKLNAFAEHIIKCNLNVDFHYYNPISESKWKENIDLVKANEIMNTLSGTTINELTDINKIGKFTALNCKTGHFTFGSNDEEEFTGYFDDLVIPNMPNLTFVDFYEIKIKRKQSKNIFDSDFKFEDKIISCLEKTS